MGQQISNIELLAWGPVVSIIAGLVGGSIVALYIHFVTIPKLDHITELTNSTLTAAHKRIDELKSIVSILTEKSESES